MMVARTAAGHHSLLPLKYNAEAAAKEDAVCPDGKEKSVGLGIKS